MGIYLRHAVTRMTQLQAYVMRVCLKTTHYQRLPSRHFEEPWNYHSCHKTSFELFCKHDIERQVNRLSDGQVLGLQTGL